MHQEKYNLTWHAYSDHLQEMLHGMMASQDFTDVTLVCNDQKKIKAHKVVLSACSPVFRNILSENNHPHPMIYSVIFIT